MNKTAKIYVAGHRGMVGSAIVRKLTAVGHSNIVGRTGKELDLRDPHAAEAFFREEKPEYVFLAAARVGGIGANAAYKAQFYYDNIMISTNVIHAAYESGVKKLLNLGSSCIYPKLAPQPLKEEYLLTGALEPTNEAYAVAKIGAVKMCRYYNDQYGTDFLSVMPTNLYGPNDNFDPETSHVLPALLRKIHEAKQSGAETVILWGDGSPLREFLYVDDLAEAVVFLMNNFRYGDLGELVNLGTGTDISIKELARLIASIAGYTGSFEWDTSKPNGTPRKLLDVSKINELGWRARTSLEEGIRRVYEWFCAHEENSPGGTRA